jgi:hypothetical protein
MKRLAYFLLVILLLCSWLGLAETKPGYAAPASMESEKRLAAQTGLQLADLLNADGRLNLPRGFSGSLDATGYRLISGPHDAPQFAPLELSAPGPGNENWSSGFNVPHINNSVYVVAVAPDGNVYIGGIFTRIGTAAFNNIARWDGTAWRNLRNGTNNAVRAIIFDGGGNVYVGGQFTTASGVTVNRVARWDGSNWFALGTGMNNIVYALARDSLGNLYAGGSFTTANGSGANRVARWNGTTWSALGSGTNNIVRALVVDEIDRLYAGGQFTTAGGNTVNRVARWDGAAWSGLNGGVNQPVYALLYQNGNLYAGGQFTVANFNTGQSLTVNRVARWDGSVWNAMASGFTGTVWALSIDSGGVIYAAGEFTRAGTTNISRVAAWNGSAWAGLADGLNNTVYGLAVNGSDHLFAAGIFAASGTEILLRLAEWDGAAWQGVTPAGAGNGADNTVYALAAAADGDIYVGGAFFTVGNTLVNYIARWDGANWHSLGSGMNNTVRALALAPDGSLVAGGQFTNAGGTPANRIARWNGSSWSVFGTAGNNGVNNTVYALAFDSAGNLYAGGEFTQATGITVNRVARWDGTAWNALGSGTVGTNNIVYALAVDSTDTLYAGGSFTTAGGVTVNRVASWNSSTNTWSTLSGGVNNIVWALIVDENDDLYVGGQFVTAGGNAIQRLARWDGASWSSVGADFPATVRALAYDSAGQLYATGDFTTLTIPPGSTSTVTMRRIARWNGVTWSPLGNGINNGSGYAVVAHPEDGDIFAGGNFWTVGANNNYSSNIAAWTGAVGRRVTGPGTYTFYRDNLPITITVTTTGDLSQINIQRFNRNHPHVRPQQHRQPGQRLRVQYHLHRSLRAHRQRQSLPLRWQRLGLRHVGLRRRQQYDHPQRGHGLLRLDRWR